MAEKEPPRDKDNVRKWLKEQGFYLEHETATALPAAGFLASLGQVYRDAESGKLRDIDVLAELRPGFEAPRMLVAIECKAGNSGAWIVRLATFRKGEVLTSPIATDRLREFLGERPHLVSDSLPVGPSVAFAVMVAGNAQIAHGAIQQAISSAQGLIAAPRGSTFAYPVLVIDAPLFGLTYDSANQESLTDITSARVVFSAAHKLGGPTLVDVVHHDALPTYLSELRRRLSGLAASIGTAGWPADE